MSVESVILDLPEAQFGDAWRGLTDAQRSAIGSRGFERFRALTKHVDASIARAERETKRKGNGADAMPTTKLVTASLPEFLSAEFKPREKLLGPFVTQALIMAYGPRGIGKTRFLATTAIAAASGGTAFTWQASRPVRTAYLDGEMAGVELQDLFASLYVAAGREWDGSTLRIVTPDMQKHGIPDLATLGGQLEVEDAIGDAELIYIDNLSAWVRGTGEENTAESWLPVLDFLLRQRSQGRSVVIAHHAGKSGQQRGTSKREDILDVVLALRRPAQYSPQDGAKFEVHFEKARGLHGEAVAPFEAQLGTDEHGISVWTTRTIEVATFDHVVTLQRDGLSPSEIARELGINKSNVSRAIKKARATGLIPDATECTAQRYATRKG